MKKVIFCIIVMTSLVFSESASQTTWIGGWGVEGPVTEFGNAFYISDNINYYYNEGKLVLAYNLASEGKREHIGELTSAIIVQTGDVDEDWDVDVVAASTGDSGKIVWFENLGGGNYDPAYKMIKELPYPSYYVSDIDEEDGIDIVLCNDYVSPNVFWYENDGMGNFTEWGIGSGYNSVDAPGTADFDNDGDIDIVASARNGAGGIRWYENNGSENFTTHIITEPPYYGQNEPFIPTGDIDKDGDLDFVIVRTNYHNVDWWENRLIPDGDVSFQLHSIQSGYTSPVHPWLADLDQDGDDDIVTTSSGLGSVDWWENDGSGNFTHHVISDSYPNAQHFAVVDVDYDGDYDIVTASAGDNALDWWENINRAEDFQQGRFFSDYNGAKGVWVGDIMGNGLPIVVSTASGLGSIDWFKIQAGYRDSGYLTSSILDTEKQPDQYLDWGRIYWSGDEPYDSNITFQVRASNDPENMGDWSDEIDVSGVDLSDYISDNMRYMQYKVNLYNGGTTPTLYEVTIYWSFSSPSGVMMEAVWNDDKVEVSWEADENILEGILGFNLYRRVSVSEGYETTRVDTFTSMSDIMYKWKRVNDGLIRGENPFLYSDLGVVSGKDYEYMLEGVYDYENAELALCKVNGEAEMPESFSVLSVYPNPSSDAVNVRMFASNDGVATIMIYDISGRLLNSYNSYVKEGESVFCLDVAGLSNNLYLLKVNFEGDTVIRRFVILK